MVLVCLASPLPVQSLLADSDSDDAVIPTAETAPPVPPFTVRPGYRVEAASPKLNEARFMAFDDAGILYVSQPYTGRIITIRDTDSDGLYETQATYIEGNDYKRVHGMCFYDGWMWFAPTGSIHRGRDTNGDGVADEVETIIAEGNLPQGGGHWWRSLLVNEKGIYTSIGDSGNINDETDTERQKIWHFDLKGGNKELFASGLRNNEKLRNRPGTFEVWGHDHGSDWFGRELGEKYMNQPLTDIHPPEEFNHYQKGRFYGHPFVTGAMVPRYEYLERDDILELVANTTAPEWAEGPHWAGNGFCFVTEGTKVGEPGDAFVAYHGSWNSTVKRGYCIQRVLFDEVTGKPFGSLTLVSTLGEKDEKGQATVLARPVDCVQAPDGSLLFSCDFTHRIYRIVSESSE